VPRRAPERGGFGFRVGFGFVTSFTSVTLGRNEVETTRPYGVPGSLVLDSRNRRDAARFDEKEWEAADAQL
jgi:hypothetical protein